MRPVHKRYLERFLPATTGYAAPILLYGSFRVRVRGMAEPGLMPRLRRR